MINKAIIKIGNMSFIDMAKDPEIFTWECKTAHPFVLHCGHASQSEDLLHPQTVTAKHDHMTTAAWDILITADFRTISNFTLGANLLHAGRGLKVHLQTTMVSVIKGSSLLLCFYF